MWNPGTLFTHLRYKMLESKFSRVDKLQFVFNISYLGLRRKLATYGKVIVQTDWAIRIVWIEQREKRFHVSIWKFWNNYAGFGLAPKLWHNRNLNRKWKIPCAKYWQTQEGDLDRGFIVQRSSPPSGITIDMHRIYNPSDCLAISQVPLISIMLSLSSLTNTLTFQTAKSWRIDFMTHQKCVYTHTLSSVKQCF